MSSKKHSRIAQFLTFRIFILKYLEWFDILYQVIFKFLIFRIEIFLLRFLNLLILPHESYAYTRVIQISTNVRHIIDINMKTHLTKGKFYTFLTRNKSIILNRQLRGASCGQIASANCNFQVSISKVFKI